MSRLQQAHKQAQMQGKDSMIDAFILGVLFSFWIANKMCNRAVRWIASHKAKTALLIVTYTMLWVLIIGYWFMIENDITLAQMIAGLS